MVGRTPLPEHPLVKTAQIEITCPACGYRMVRTAARLRRHGTISCPRCGHSFTLDLPEASSDQKS
ncbi:MAG: YnfU family zinc-binding protein [Xanthobacteraceae bacterium]